MATLLYTSLDSSTRKFHNALMEKREKKPPPEWFVNLQMPQRLRDRLEHLFTLHRDGYARWYKGNTRFACPRSAPPEEVENIWKERQRAIDNASPKPVKKDASGVVLRELYSQYIERQRRRAETGRPKPLSPFTLEDQIRTLREFVKHLGGDTLVSDLEPIHFNNYIAQFDQRAASTVARKVAYVKGMFSWGYRANVCPLPLFGPDFVKPTASVHRDERLSKTKSYTREEIASIWKVANEQERLWILLALNGAMDNSDVSTLSTDVIDFEEGTLDFRRRKKGRVRRLIPLHKETLTRLKSFKAPSPADPQYANLVFRTEGGFPLVRMKKKEDSPGRATPVDYISFRWTKLLQRAGIRPKAERVVVELPDGTRKRKTVWHKPPSGDRRGFRGLRTTFGNAVPPGYTDERNIIMGHSHGNTFLDNYLEKVGVKRLREVVDHVWKEVFKGLKLSGQERTTKKKNAAA